MTKPVDKNKQLRARRDSKAPKVRKSISVNPKYKNKKRKKIKSSENIIKRIFVTTFRWFLGFFGSFFLVLQS